MARAGLSNLIRRLRGMAQIGTADYSLVIGDGSTVVWWSDSHAQDILDAYRMDHQYEMLTPAPEYLGGTNIFKNYYAANHDWEEATSGSVYWLVVDSAGNDAGTANYSVDYIAGLVRFSADKLGTAYFLTGRTYNLNAAAAQIWREKAASTAAFYTFKTDNQSFDRSQWFDHCMKMAQFYDGEAGIKTSRLKRADMLPGQADSYISNSYKWDRINGDRGGRW